tara:strand:- start:731 stop:922 length:192 start_codon:yes stop_codon:yes gene_type:complete
MKFTDEELVFLHETIQVYKARCEGATNRKLRKNSWTLEDREEVKKMATFHKKLLEKIEYFQSH